MSDHDHVPIEQRRPANFGGYITDKYRHVAAALELTADERSNMQLKPGLSEPNAKYLYVAAIDSVVSL